MKAAGVVASLLLLGAFVVGFSGKNFISVANAGATTSTTETISVTVNQVITLNTSSSITLPALTPGTPVYATTTAQVTTNAPSGWQIIVTRPAASTTAIASGTITFPDQTLFTGSNATSAANLVSGGQVLAFRAYQTGTSAGIYNTTTWGTDDTVPNAFWAGIPTSTTAVMISTSSYTGSAQNVVFGVRANSPSTQVATTYTGTITVTAIALP